MDQSEVWKPVAGLPGYDVSSLGRVRTWWSKTKHEVVRNRRNGERVVEKRLLKMDEPRMVRRNRPRFGPSWIVKVWFRGRRTTRSLDILVCDTFVRQREIPIHIDGDWGNNRASNLRWGSRSESVAMRPPKPHSCKLTREKAEEIRRRIANGETQKSLAKEFGVTGCAISKIKNGQLWKEPDLDT